MTEFTVRDWLHGDVPELREIFAASFGDPPEIIDAFHRLFLSGPDCCVVAAVPDARKPEGRAVSAGYMLPGPVLCFPGLEQVHAAYLYALGCLPAWRRRGIGSAVYRALLVRGKSMAPVVCVVPASEALVRTYDRICPLVHLGGIRVAEMNATQAAAVSPPAVQRISAEEYALRREEWLAPYPHASYPLSFYRIMAEYGNLFLALPGALAAVIPLEDRCILSELLCPEADPAQVISGVSTACPAERFEIRTPVFFPGPGEFRRYAYCHPAAEMPAVPDSFWYPFGME